MIVRNSLFDRRERVNVDSLLAFDGGNQYASAGLNPNIIGALDYDRDWTIGILLMPQAKATNPQNPYLFSTGKIDRGLNLYFRQAASELNINLARTNAERIHARVSIAEETLQYLTIKYQAQGQNITVQQNGINELPVNYVSKGTITASVHTLQDILFGTPEAGLVTSGRAGKFSLSHLAVYNRITSTTEDRFTHRHGGIIPQSTHAACVAHYVADREGLTMWDVVEQYNWAKPLARVYSEDAYAASGSTAFSGDSNLEITIPKYPLDNQQEWYRVKLVSAITEGNATTFGVGEMVFTQVNDRFSIYQNGTFLTQILSVLQGDVIRISRVGSQITVYQNNVQRATYASISSNLFPVYVPLGIDAPTPVISLNSSSINWNNFKGVLIRDGVFVKTNHLLSHNATLQNFTPQQVEGSQQSAYLDFYDKTPLHYGTPVDGYRWSGAGLTPDTAGISGGNWSTEILLNFRDYINDNSSFKFGFGLNLELRFRGNKNESALRVQWVNNSIPGAILLTPKLTRNKLIHIAVTYNASTQTIRSYVDGKLFVEQSGVDATISGGSNSTISYGSNKDIRSYDLFKGAWYDYELLQSDVDKIIKNQLPTVEPFALYYFYDKDTVPNLGSFAGGDLTRYEPATAHRSYGLVEKASLLPPLVNALRFDAASNQYASVSGFTPTKEKGYTIVMAIQRDGIVSSVEHLFSMNVAKFRAYLTPTQIAISNSTGVRGGGTLAYNVTPDFTTITLLCFTIRQVEQGVDAYSQIFLNGRLIAEGGGTGTYVGFDELSGNLKIGRNSGADDFNGNILSFGIAKGIITPSQVLEMWNNSLLANPKKEWRNLDWQLQPHFNQINDDGAANYTIADNSPQAYVIPLFGFTAANLDPGDPAYSLQSINSLR